jgi:RNA polymerase sigma-70 factor (ECF subfamily)
MATINLRDFYPWYTQDEFVEVPDAIAGELFADRRYQKADRRRMYRNKVYSLDAEDGIENAVHAHPSNDPLEVIERKERHCRLCRALNSLPEKQGRRVAAHYLAGKSRREIACAEGVSESAVNAAIEKGLTAMKNYLQNCHGGGCQMASK